MEINEKDLGEKQKRDKERIQMRKYTILTYLLGNGNKYARKRDKISLVRTCKEKGGENQTRVRRREENDEIVSG